MNATKLTADHFALLSAILASSKGDLTLSVTRAMCPTPEALATAIDGNPALADYLATAVDGYMVRYAALKGALVASKPGTTPVPVVSDAAPGSLRDKILAFLKDNARSNVNQIKEAIGAASGGGVAAAIKVALEKKQIVCHEPTQTQPLKTYSLTEDYARTLGAK